MREQIVELAKTNPAQGANILREQLQWILLAGLHQSEVFREIAFVGGTCLRLCHGLHRFSEDLDFSAYKESESDPLKWLRALKKQVHGSGFIDAEITYSNPEANVLSVNVRFPAILFEAGLSPHRTQKLMIKLEIDRRPPKGATTTRMIFSKPSLMAITLHDLPSLMAGKLHAILARPFTKGRDWYDLIWYCGQKIQPNEILLENALQQIPSPWCDNPANWHEAILRKNKVLDWEEVHRDVDPFLEKPGDQELLMPETIDTLLEYYVTNQKRLRL